MPEENLDDEQWRLRETFSEVEHPELGKSCATRIRRCGPKRAPGEPGRARRWRASTIKRFCGGELGLTREELRRLKESHVI